MTRSLVSWRIAIGAIVLVGVMAALPPGPHPAAGQGPIDEAKAHLRANAKRFGLRADLADLAFVEVKESPAGKHVRFRQTINGIPIENATVNVSLPIEDRPIVASSYVPSPRRHAVSGPQIGRETAVAIALDAISASGPSLYAEPSAEAVYIRDGPRYTLSWRVLASASEPFGAWLVYVRASSGKVISIGNISTSDDGRVFDPNPLQDSVCNEIGACPNPSNCQTAANADILTGDFAQGDTQGWSFVRQFQGIQAGQNKLKGQFADATAGGGVANKPDRQFRYPCDDPAFEEAMAYYHVDSTQRKIRNLGFTTILNQSFPIYARQTINPCNAYYDPNIKAILFGTVLTPPPVPASNNCPVDMAEDADVVVHEYGHAIHDNQVKPYSTCIPPVPRVLANWPGTCLQTWAMGEGFGDFNAGVRYDSPCVAEWANFGTLACNNNSSFGLRSLENTAKWTPPNGPAIQLPTWCSNPGVEHCAGLIWGGALWDIAKAIGSNDIAYRIVLQSHFFLVTNPTFVQARDAVCTADMLLYGGQHVELISGVFVGRGLGACAGAVGGSVGLLDDAASPATTEDRSAGTPLAPIGAAALAGVLALGAGAWYVRRRLVRLG